MSIIFDFAKNVKRHRLSQNISQEKLAELSDLHRTYISDIERGTRNITITNVEKIANALGIEAYKLLIKEDKS